MTLLIRRALAMLCCLILLIPCAALGDQIVELPIDFSPGMKVRERYEKGKMEYHDPSIDVVREYNSKGRYHVVRVRIATPNQLRTVAAESFNSRAKNEVANIAKKMNAVLAINGDYFSDHPGSFVLRQGQVFRGTVNENRDILLIDEDGDFHIILAEEKPGEMDLTQFEGKKIINGFEFGPALVRDGIRVQDDSKSPKNSHPNETQGRICICQTGELEYMIVACKYWSMTVTQMTDLVMSFGNVQQAYMLDGGLSVNIVFLGKKVNDTDVSTVRAVPDIIYFASAWDAN